MEPAFSDDEFEPLALQFGNAEGAMPSLTTASSPSGAKVLPLVQPDSGSLHSLLFKPPPASCGFMCHLCWRSPVTCLWLRARLVCGFSAAVLLSGCCCQ